MLNIQEFSLIAIAVLLAAILFVAFRILFALRDKPAPAFRQELEMVASRGVLPMSSLSGKGRVPEVYVFDEADGAFRRVGLADANGKVDLKDLGGDGIRLVKGKLYRIVGRPQTVALRPERICIAKGTTPNGAADWNVHDIKVGNRSQLAQSGVLPGDMFAMEAVDASVTFETIQTAMDFSLDVSYCGPNDAEPFVCSVIGTEARYSA